MKWYDLAFSKHVYLPAFLYGAGWQASHEGKLREEDADKLRVHFKTSFLSFHRDIKVDEFFIFWRYCNYFGEDASIYIYLCTFDYIYI